jgi:hypothetical protein
VPFVCQDAEQRNRILNAADRELTGQHWYPSVPLEEKTYIGRRRILFAREVDAHKGRLEGMQLPAEPPNDWKERSDSAVRRVRRPGQRDLVMAAA